LPERFTGVCTFKAMKTCFVFMLLFSPCAIFAQQNACGSTDLKIGQRVTAYVNIFSDLKSSQGNEWNYKSEAVFELVIDEINDMEFVISDSLVRLAYEMTKNDTLIKFNTNIPTDRNSLERRNKKNGINMWETRKSKISKKSGLITWSSIDMKVDSVKQARLNEANHDGKRIVVMSDNKLNKEYAPEALLLNLPSGLKVGEKWKEKVKLDRTKRKIIFTILSISGDTAIISFKGETDESKPTDILDIRVEMHSTLEGEIIFDTKNCRVLRKTTNRDIENSLGSRSLFSPNQNRSMIVMDFVYH
jgi:hypothetical protein